MRCTWLLKEATEESVQALTAELALPPLTARLLVNRGIVDPDQAYRFLHPRFEDLHKPGLMKDMGRVVQRIFRALEGREKIRIYGDYDVDGVTSSLILKRALEILGGQVEIHLPRRLKDGYGVRTEVLEHFHSEGVRLVITSDCGIRAFEACERARELGLDVLVCDHHLPAEKLPVAKGILNPKRSDCSYPDKNLAAAGVAFKLVQALFEMAGRAEVLPHFLKVAALGTAADMVPLVGENRILVKLGLEGLSRVYNVGLQALLKGSGVSGVVDVSDIAFKIAPRINAVTRMGGGPELLDLFDTVNPMQAEVIVQNMNLKNQQRRRQEEIIMEEITELQHSKPDLFQKTFLVVAGKNWHRGVIGIVASRLVERFFRPSLVLSLGESDCQGSGRSIPGFHLLEAMEECGDLLSQYGGHAQAVGCTIENYDEPSQWLQELSTRLDSQARSLLLPDQLVPSLSLDSFLPSEVLSMSFFQDVQQLAPFGVGNPLPIFASQRLEVAAGPWILKGKHLKIQLVTPSGAVDAIWWKNGDAADNIQKGSQVNVAYTLSRNEYRGVESLLMTIQDLQLHSSSSGL